MQRQCPHHECGGGCVQRYPLTQPQMQRSGMAECARRHTADGGGRRRRHVRAAKSGRTGPPLNEHRDKCGVADCAPTMMTSMRVPLVASRPQCLGRRGGEAAGILRATRLLSESPSPVVSGHGVPSRSCPFMHDGTAEWDVGERTEASRRSGQPGFVWAANQVVKGKHTAS